MLKNKIVFLIVFILGAIAAVWLNYTSTTLDTSIENTEKTNIIYDKAIFVRDSIQKKDFAAAENTITQIITESKITLNGFQPYDTFFEILLRAEDLDNSFSSALELRLNRWGQNLSQASRNRK
jgi:hypothetical protein